MRTLTESQLKEFTTGDLLNLLSPSFHISKTYFDDPYKQYMVQHQYALIAEVNINADIDTDMPNDIHSKLPDVDEWETFGYPTHLLKLAATPEVFGSTAKQALINFFVKHPEHLTIKE